jgi:WD40 repeat protein
MTHSDAVVHAAFSPDGLLVATVSDDYTARIWDAATGEPIALPFEHTFNVRHAAFSPDGRLLLTASWDKTARLWDISSSTWSVEDIADFSALEASAKFDSSNTLQPLTPQQVSELLDQLKKSHPEIYLNTANNK